MENIPDVWVGAISAIAGGFLVGGLGLIAKFIEVSSARRTLERKIYREKIEFLYLRVGDFLTVLSDAQFEYVKGDLDLDQNPDVFLNRIYTRMNEIQMLVDLYAPQHRDEVEQVHRGVNDYVAGILERDGDFESVTANLRSAEDRIEALNVQLRSSFQKLAKPRPQ